MRLTTTCLLLIFFLQGIVFAEDAPRPNIILILSDDQRYDTLGPDSTDVYMPTTQRELFDKGVAFRRGYVTTPKCCPSRASILTGKYASRHLVTENISPLQEPTIGSMLRNVGYRTGIVGKFLNSSDGTPKPEEFDFWVSYFGGSSRYKNKMLNVNGEWGREPRYTTRAFTDYALEFIRSTGDEPFFLYYAAIAPHRPARPEPMYRGVYNRIARHRPPSFNSRGSRGTKPRWVRARRSIERTRARAMENFRRRQLATLRSLDDGVGDMIALLAEEGKLENTLIVYLSDNGIHWGEHGLFGKDSVYEESIRVPFAIRYDGGLAQPGQVRDELVANIDLVPTFLELAGVSIPEDVDGVSLVPLLSSTEPVLDWRTHIFIEVWRDLNPRRRSHFGVHTGERVFAMHVGGEEEFYRLNSDPFQMRNLLHRNRRNQSAEIEQLRGLVQEHMLTFFDDQQLQAYTRRRR